MRNSTIEFLPIVGADKLAGPEGPASSPRPSRMGRLIKATAMAAMAVVVLGAVVTILGPLVLPYRTYFVRSGSMRPTIPVGALAVYRPVSGPTLGPGDIIAFVKPGGHGEIVTHRIVTREETPGGPMFVTKGDANGVPDNWRVPAGGKGWRFDFQVPYIGYVIGELGTSLGRLAVLAFIVVALAAVVLMALWRSDASSDLDEGSRPAENHRPVVVVAAITATPKFARAFKAISALKAIRLPPGIRMPRITLPPKVTAAPKAAADPKAAAAPAAAAPKAAVAPRAAVPSKVAAVTGVSASSLTDALTIVLGHSELLLRQTPPDDPRRVDVEAIHAAALQVARVIDKNEAGPVRRRRNIRRRGRSATDAASHPSIPASAGGDRHAR